MHIIIIIILVRKPEGKRSLGEPDVDESVILRWIFGKWQGWRLDGVGSGQVEMPGTCDYGDELSGSKICREFLDQLQKQLVSK